MEFRLQGTVKGFGLHRGGPDRFSFRAGDERPIRVQLWTDRTENRPRLRYRAISAFVPTPDVQRAFQSLAANRYPRDSQPQNTLDGDVATAGRAWERWADMPQMPHYFRAFVDQVGGELSREAARGLALLWWRAGELRTPLPALGERFFWNLDDGRWLELPTYTRAWMAPYSYPELSNVGRDDIERLASSCGEVPLAYELIREAWALSQTHPRSALIAAMTALEIAIKQFIADRVPDASWLMDNSPAPDVIKLLTDYVPTLDPPPGAPMTATRVERIPNELLVLLKKRRNQRNQVAHQPAAYNRSRQGGPPEITSERAKTAVLAVREVLYRLDAADGYQWAAGYQGSGLEDAPSSGYRRIPDGG